MKLSETIRSLTGQGHVTCPDEAEVLGYLESRLSALSRARLERHFANCDDCRELLVVSGRRSAETPAPLADETVREQTSKVLSLIYSDELNRNKPKRRLRMFPGLDVSRLRFGAAALTICAIATIAIVSLNREPRPEVAAMKALALAVKNERQTEAQISGGLAYSQYNPNRGVQANGDDLQFSLAISELKSAEQETAPVNDRLVLARVYLARGAREDVKHALTILDQVATRGVESAEALNDTGVAHFELGNYEDAISYFRTALTKSPNYYEALFNKALAEERTGNKEQARQDWEQFINKSSDENWKSEARKHLNSLTGVSNQ
jgi:tetratricopeptide (TPR) repeat protein